MGIDDKAGSVSRLVRACYHSALFLTQVVRFICIREVVVDRHHLTELGDSVFILAPTHIAHIEPMLVSCQLTRHVTWVARKEFFAWRSIAVALHSMGTICIDRFGVPVRAIRHAIARVRAGNLVGIFPEGGVQRGKNLIVRGGVNKGGACLISMRTGVPILPIVILGTEKLSRVAPWLPAKRARTYLAYGKPIWPKSERGRTARHDMMRELQAEYARAYQALLEATGIRDDEVP